MSTANPAPRRAAAHMLLGLLAAWSVAAAGEDLPGSGACRHALEALERAEGALLARGAAASAAGASDDERRRSVAARLYPQRQAVADACLGGLTTSPPPSQHTWNAPPPQRYAPLPPRAQPPSRPADPLPLPRFDPPVTVTQCHGATCLASDGSTLTRVGPTLVGPRGACIQQGLFVRCP